MANDNGKLEIPEKKKMPKLGEDELDNNGFSSGDICNRDNLKNIDTSDTVTLTPDFATQTTVEDELDQRQRESLQLSVEPLETMDKLLQYVEPDPALKAVIASEGKVLSLSFSKEYKMGPDKVLRKASGLPKLLVCHDYRGGYGEDKFIRGTDNPRNYTFQHWMCTDIFVYFSHKFITIPPLGWVNAAHSNGVKILGTIITENDDGKLVCEELLKNSNRVDEVVDKLCKINEDFLFDGYLVNIENPINEKVGLLLEFIEKLNKKLKGLSPKNLVIYYDSIINDGNLKWQNELNELNRSFFDICDGIFLNYCWKDENLVKSLEMSQSRSSNVFVGVDVFGRGCYGGGGLSTKLALEKVNEVGRQKLSVAIFAPGWSFECHPYNEYLCIDENMWSPCYEYVSFKCLEWAADKSDSLNDATELSRSKGLSSSIDRRRLLFQTDFSRGCGLKYFENSKFQIGNETGQGPRRPRDLAIGYTFFRFPVCIKVVEGKPWFNLTYQSLQPLLLSSAPDDEPSSSRAVTYNMDYAYQGGGCLNLNGTRTRRRSAEGIPEQETCVYSLNFPIVMPLKDANVKVNEYLALLCIWTSRSTFFPEEQESNSEKAMDFSGIQVAICFFGEAHSLETKPKLIKIEDVIVSNEGKSHFEITINEFFNHKTARAEMHQNLTFVFQGPGLNTQSIGNWNFSCYVLNMCDMAKFGDFVSAIIIGSVEKISVGYVSLLKVAT